MKIEDIVVGERYWTRFESGKTAPCVCLGTGGDLVVVKSLMTGCCAAIHHDHFICHMQPRWWEFWKKKPKAVSEVKKESPIGEKPTSHCMSKLQRVEVTWKDKETGHLWVDTYSAEPQASGNSRLSHQ